MVRPYLSVIIPAYNEEKRLPLTLIDVDRHLSQAEYNYEIIIVNDGSTDKTGEVLRRFQPLIKNLQVIDNKTNEGKGAAVKIGMMSAKGSIRLFMDADNTTPVSEFAKMAHYFKEGYDVVNGARYMRGAKVTVRPPFLRWLVDWKVNFFIRLFILKGVRDTFSGFKVFSEEAANAIFPALKTRGWAFDVEALAIARRAGYKVKEAPVVWGHHPDTHLPIWRYAQIFWETITIFWKHRK